MKAGVAAVQESKSDLGIVVDTVWPSAIAVLHLGMLHQP